MNQNTLSLVQPIIEDTELCYTTTILKQFLLCFQREPLFSDKTSQFDSCWKHRSVASVKTIRLTLMRTHLIWCLITSLMAFLEQVQVSRCYWRKKTEMCGGSYHSWCIQSSVSNVSVFSRLFGTWSDLFFYTMCTCKNFERPACGTKSRHTRSFDIFRKTLLTRGFFKKLSFLQKKSKKSIAFFAVWRRGTMLTHISLRLSQ